MCDRGSAGAAEDTGNWIVHWVSSRAVDELNTERTCIPTGGFHVESLSRSFDDDVLLGHQRVGAECTSASLPAVLAMTHDL